MTGVALTSLVKTYGSTRAIDGVSLSVEQGEFVSLLGPSGCGKTTTLKIIAGFEEPDSGAVAFDGRDVTHTPAEKRDIGMVFQNYALFPHMTVVGNLAFGLEMRHVAKAEMAARIARVVDMVQLKGMEDRYPRQLSGGQQQRVALARALVIEPSILLLDEPLANLDAKLRDEMRSFVRDLQRRVGITAIYVTHDQSEAITMSDRVVVMFKGRVAQAASPSDIYERPASLEVASFVGQANVIEGRAVRRINGAYQAETALGDIVFAAGGDVASDRTALLLVRPEALTLTSCNSSAPHAALVESMVYSGSAIDYRLRLADGSALQAQTAPHVRFSPGDRVRATTASGAAWHLGSKA
ncbi:ABC transporter ATP-binding protein [Terrarubrum flagellatum]|uniref:ABC transporter ATP-binding protein n=1 Tax=Terrirubrum flagellatum TaxID=2895980 RepID=UPI003145397D